MNLRARSATRPLSKWILAAAIIGIGAAYLAVTSGVPRAAARFKERLNPGVVTAVPAGTEDGPAAMDLRNVRPVSPEIPNARFRFGFLEFEDDPDASTK